jgi:hypothetical protein
MTGTTVITNRVRPILADNYADGNAAQRWSDTLLIQWLNDGVELIVAERPEALLTAAYTMGTVTAVSAIGNTVSIGDRYQEALVDYVCGRALSQDSQDERDLARARLHFNQFVIKAGLPIKAPAVAVVAEGRRL